MGITLHPPENPQRFRVTRTWKKMAFQAYVPIGRDLAKAQKEAQLLDAKLAERQRAYLLRKEVEGLHVMHPNGKIVGLLRQQRHRQGRHIIDAFRIRLVVDGKGTVNKEFEINSRRTVDEAFIQSVDFIAQLREVEKNSSLYRRMLASKPLYTNITSTPPVPPKGDLSDNELFHILAAEVERFQKNRRNKIIRG